MSPMRSDAAVRRPAIGLIALLLLLGVCSGGQNLPAQEVSVAVFDGAAPMVFVDEDGEPAGVYPDLLGRLIEDLGYTPRFEVGLTFSEAYRASADGAIDLMPAVVYSPDRDRELDFNRIPVATNWGQLGVRPGEDVESILDLRDRRVGLMTDGQNGINFVAMMQDFDVPFVPVYYDSFDEIRAAVVAGDIAAGVFFNAWFYNVAGIVPSSVIFNPTQGFVATADGENGELLIAIDRRLEELKADESSYYYAVLDRWLTAGGGAIIPRWVRTGAVFAAFTMAVLAVFVLVLRREVHRATRAVSESRQRYRMVADHAAGWEFWRRPDGSFEYVSPNTSVVTGYPAQAFLETPELMERIVVPEDRPIWTGHLATVRATDDTSPGAQPRGHAADEPPDLIFRIRRADGAIRWIRHQCAPIHDHDGTYLGERGANTDITTRLAYESEIRASLDQKEAMLQEIYHRVRNNLQLMASLVAIQQDGIADPGTRQEFAILDRRLSAIRLAHAGAYSVENTPRVEMRDLLHVIAAEVFPPARTDRAVAPRIEADEIYLDLTTAVACSLIVMEVLGDIAEEHRSGATPDSAHVRLSRAGGDSVRLSVWTRMVVRQRPIDRDLIDTLALQIRGTVSTDTESGCAVEVRFPADPSDP